MEKNSLEKNIDEYKVLDAYKTKLELKELKPKTVETKLWAIIPFLKQCNKEPSEIKQEDVESYYLTLKNLKINTRRRYLIELRYFLKVNKIENDFFDEINIKKEKKRLQSKDLITIVEFQLILKQTRNFRDRVLIWLFWDSAARLSEIINLKKEDVYVDQFGLVIAVDGKTGKRTIRLAQSELDVKKYISTLSEGEYLFTVNGKHMSAHSAHNIVENAAKRAGITKKIYPHLFRHSKLTDMVKNRFTEPELRMFAGWSGESDMPATYVHLSNEDLDKHVLENAGVEVEKPIQQSVMNVKTCPRCGTKNTFDNIYCTQCNMVLDQLHVSDPLIEMQKKIEELDKKLYKQELEHRAALGRERARRNPIHEKYVKRTEELLKKYK